MDINTKKSAFEEMVTGMVTIGTRANGKQTITKEQATLLIQAHISSAAPCQDEQNLTNLQQENCCDSCPHHPTSFLSDQKMNQGQAAHLQLARQPKQAKPTPLPQCK